MSKFVVDLDKPQSAAAEIVAPPFGAYQNSQKKPNGLVKALKILGIALGLIVLAGAVGGYFYWQSLKKTPQYSLALIVDAARRDDREAINALVDTDAAVDD